MRHCCDLNRGKAVGGFSTCIFRVVVLSRLRLHCLLYVPFFRGRRLLQFFDIFMLNCLVVSLAYW